MKYFGKKSLSSVLSGLLNVSWYLAFIAVILAPLLAGVIILFSTPLGESIAKGEINICGNYKNQSKNIDKDFQKDMAEKDRKDWENFKKLPIVVKILVFPYIESVVVLLLIIIKKSKELFSNFKNEIVFNKSNAVIISKISKLNIGFSILTFSFSLLLVSVLLFLLCEIFKKGSALQEEHDLTV